jgi:hypothetical protein
MAAKESPSTSKGTLTSDQAVGTGLPECFIIMPITDPEGYEKGHFKHVYSDIVAPACSKSGFRAIRADDVKQTNLIHLDVLQKLLESPMAVCDLSTRNPNALFELALRQAFDKPVALIQEIGTKPIFDIAPLRYTEYRKERVYHEVLEDQATICTAIKETFSAHEKGQGVNSIVKLLVLTRPASLPDTKHPDATSDLQQVILAEIGELRNEFRSAVRNLREEFPSRARQVRFDREQDQQTRLDYETERLAHLVHRAEMLLVRSDFQDRPSLDFREAAVECRERLRFLMHQPHSQHHADTLREIEMRLDMLEIEYARMLDSSFSSDKSR